MSDKEIWKPAPNWPEYDVSNLGRVRRVAPPHNGRSRAVVGKIRKPSILKATGYLVLRLTRPGGESQSVLVHRLVAIAFLGSPPTPKHEVNHIDSDRANPKLDNLEWVTKSENRQHGYDHGYCDAKGERNGQSVLGEDDIHKIRLADTATSAAMQRLADEMGVTATTIQGIATGKHWRHVVTPGWEPRAKSRKPMTLSDEQVLEIRRRYGGSYGEKARLSEEYGVGASTITAILKGKARTIFTPLK